MLKHISNHGFYSASGLLFAVAIGVAGFNYLFQMTMARFISLEEFGLLNVLFSLLAVLTFPSKVIQTGAAKYVASHEQQDIRGLLKLGLKVSSFFLVGYLLGSPFIRSSLRIERWLPVGIVSVWVFCTILMLFGQGALQGFQNFKLLSVSSLVQHGLKLVLGVMAVLLGAGLDGILVGVALATIVAFLVCWRGLSSHSNVAPSEAGQLKKFLGSSKFLMLSLLLFQIFSYGDIVLAKRYLSGNDLGYFAAITVIGKGLLTLPECVMSVYFPMAARANARRESSRALLWGALLLTSVMMVAAIGVLWMARDWVLALFGPKYLAVGSRVGHYYLAMLFLGIAKVPLHFWLARDRYFFLSYLSVFTVLQLVGIMVFHGSLEEIISVVLWTCAGFSLFAFIELLLSRRSV